MAMLSLFTLSAAVMGYLFAAEPIMMYLDGKKKEAVNFFFTTVGVLRLLRQSSLPYSFLLSRRGF